LGAVCDRRDRVGTVARSPDIGSRGTKAMRGVRLSIEDQKLAVELLDRKAIE
jgi:hypothetical protein